MVAAVSVIIPCYRCSETIERAFDSLVKQTLRPKEVILVEDCSNDGGRTIGKLSELRDKYEGCLGSIVVIQNKKNGGPAASRNTGWDRAGQPYIAFLDADDSWHPSKLEIQYTWMESHPQAMLTGHSTLCIQPEDPALELPGQWVVRPVRKYLLLLSNRFPTRSVMLRRDIPFRFDPAKRYAEDYLLWLKIVLGGNSAYKFELPLAYSYKPEFGAGGLSKDLWSMERGVLDAFKQLYCNGVISWFVLMLVACVSLTKFVRRLVIVFLRKK